MERIVKHKMDPHLVSKQDWELNYLLRKFNCKRSDLKNAIKAVGNSRKKVYQYLRLRFTENDLNYRPGKK